MKKHLIMFICLIFITISIICKSNNDDQTIINLLKKKGIVLSEEKPCEDYHSPKEAVLNIKKEFFLNNKFLIPKNHKKFINENEITIAQPVLLYNLFRPNLATTEQYDYIYLIYSHDFNGNLIKALTYKYKKQSKGKNPISYTGIRRADSHFYIITQKEAQKYIENKFNIKLNKKPIGMFFYGYFSISASVTWFWYFEIESKGEFLLSPFIMDYNPDLDLFKQLDTTYFIRHGKSRFLQLTIEIDLYNRIDKKKKDINYDWYIDKPFKFIPFEFEK